MSAPDSEDDGKEEVRQLLDDLEDERTLPSNEGTHVKQLLGRAIDMIKDNLL